VAALLAERPRPHEYYRCVDGPIVEAVAATGQRIADFMTLRELQAAGARKAALACFTTPLEEAAALVVAAGLVDAAIDTVAAYMQHLLVSTRTLNETLAKLARGGSGSGGGGGGAPDPSITDARPNVTIDFVPPGAPGWDGPEDVGGLASRPDTTSLRPTATWAAAATDEAPPRSLSNE